MAFGELFKTPTAPQKTSGFGSLFATKSPEELAQYQKGQKLSYEAQQAQAAAEKANSWRGLFDNTVAETGRRLTQIGTDVKDALLEAPRPQSLDMQESLKSGWQTITDTVTSAADKYMAVPQVFDSKTPALKKGAIAGEAAMATLNLFFLGITAPLKSAEGIPGVGYVASAVNNFFGALGAGGSGVADNAVDALPISNDSKKTIRPLAREIGALTAQVVAGKLGHDAVGTIKEKVVDLNRQLKAAEVVTDNADVVPKKVPVADQSTAGQVPIKNAAGEVVARPAPETATKATPVPDITAPERAPGVTKTASDINYNLAKQGFDILPVEEQAKYSPQSFKEIADTVAKMMDDNLESVKRMAKGLEEIPKDLNKEILFNAIEALAIKEGDAALLRDLARSTVSRTSEAAQTLGGHGYNDNPNSPVDIIKKVESNRAQNLKTKGVDIPAEAEKLGAKVRETMKKNARPSWEEFIQSITCAY